MRRMFIVTAYEVLVTVDDWNEPQYVKIGILEDGIPPQVLWDSWIDSHLYYEMTKEEFAQLKIGDDLDEGTIVLEIIKEPIFYTDVYPMEELENANI